MVDPSDPFATNASDGPYGPVLAVTGELDLATAPRLLEAAEQALARRPGAPLAIELSGLTFIDSSGLRALLSIAAHTRGRVALVGPTPAVGRILDMTGTGDLLPVVGGVDDPRLGRLGGG